MTTKDFHLRIPQTQPKTLDTAVTLKAEGEVMGGPHGPPFSFMATQKQIDANRANALKSTGPRTAAGKAVSSQNALKSGLDAESQFVDGECPADFETLKQEYYDEFQPQTPDERYQLDRMIRAEWFQRRFWRVEAQLWNTLSAPTESGPGGLGAAFAKYSNIFMRLQRRIDFAQRDYREASAILHDLIAGRLESVAAEYTSAQMASFRTDAGPLPIVFAPAPEFTPAGPQRAIP